MSSPKGDQTEDPQLRFGPEIESVKSQLDRGTRASQIASSLYAKGLGTIALVFIFREATGASLADLKALGRWCSHAGVTDADQFDAWAAQVFRR
jgi:hypothetical protein